MSAKTQLKTGLPQIFKSDTALKLVIFFVSVGFEEWVLIFYVMGCFASGFAPHWDDCL